MVLNTLAHEEDTVEDRGRLCPHEVPEVLRLLVLTSRRAKRQREEFEEDGPVTLQQLVRAKAMRRLFAHTFLQHTTSYDMVSRAPVSFTDGKMTHPWLELAEANFRELTRFLKQAALSGLLWRAGASAADDRCAIQVPCEPRACHVLSVAALGGARHSCTASEGDAVHHRMAYPNHQRGNPAADGL
eukprot:COSAG05_NODE_2_length_63105_cov_159.292956_25_plen_186_part_00